MSLEVNPDAVDFGTLAPGGQSDAQVLTLSSAGSCIITVTASVTDTAAGLYVDGVLLDSGIWDAYTTEITAGAAVDSVAALDVPDSYTGVGAKEGTLVFWAQKA